MRRSKIKCPLTLEQISWYYNTEHPTELNLATLPPTLYIVKKKRIEKLPQKQLVIAGTAMVLAFDEKSKDCKFKLTLIEAGRKTAEIDVELTKLTWETLKRQKLSPENKVLIDSDNATVIEDFLHPLPLKTHILRLNDDDVPVIVEFLKQHPQITTINLSNNAISDPGISCLSQCHQLLVLNLAHNKMGNHGPKALLNMKVQTLNIAGNDVGNDGIRCLLSHQSIVDLDVSANTRITESAFKGLRENHVLKKLVIADVPFTEVGIAIIAEHKNDHSKNFIEHLTIKNANLSDRLVEQLLATNYFQGLDLSGNGLGFRSAMAIAKEQHQLDSLIIANNEFGPDSAKEIFQSKGLQLLKKLDLSGNKIGTKGIKEFIDGALPSLTELNVSDNQIDTLGAQYLGARLIKSEIWSLNLSHNNIGSFGAQGIASVCAIAKLQKINLAYNGIGNKGARTFSKIRKWPGKIIDIDFTGNEIKYHGAVDLAGAIRAEKLTVQLEKNPKLSFEGYQLIQEASQFAKLKNSNQTLTDSSRQLKYVKLLPGEYNGVTSPVRLRPIKKTGDVTEKNDNSEIAVVPEFLSRTRLRPLLSPVPQRKKDLTVEDKTGDARFFKERKKSAELPAGEETNDEPLNIKL